MQLIWFHRVLIGVAIVFFAGFGIWELLGYRTDRDITSLFSGVVALAVAVILLLYLRRLRRILKLPE